MANYQIVLPAPERWDNIAFKAYGDAGLIEGIVQANPNVLVNAIVTEGTVLNIPILTEEVVLVDENNLPPWLR